MIAIAATGVVQAYIDVRSIHGLLHTTYGALIIAKTALLVALIGLGWVNRERVIPALRRIVAAGGAPGGAGVLARRTLRGELVLMLCVFGVTAALVSYAPPIDAASGPFSVNTTLGPAVLEMTVEPARVGPNTIHLYLIDAKTGVQFTATKELTATARLPAKDIGPLPLKASPGGTRPLHPQLGRAQPGGNVGDRTRRPRLRIRTVHPCREGAGLVTEPRAKANDKEEVNACTSRSVDPRAGGWACSPPRRPPRRTSACIPTRSRRGRSRRST